jgi:microcin C transport system permease protein
MRFNPLTIKRWQRFKAIRRGYWSGILLSALILASIFAELLISNRALIVYYEGQLFFPSYGAIHSGRDFGQDYDYEADYKALQRQFAQAEDTKNWVIMPIVPYGPLETDLLETDFPPFSPSLASSHYLGTDTTGRDIVARLVYGFRIAISFSLALLVCNYLVGIVIGCIMGFWGGTFDLVFQRLIEIWSNIPMLYVIMIVASIVTPGFWSLLGIMVVFGWTSMTWYMRTATYKESTRDYVMAARGLGASNRRIIFRHILPNTVSTIITFMPFSIASGITALTALDYLGFGLPPPTPSWGELLKQGTDNLESGWIAGSVVSAMILVLMLVTYMGEAIREAFDPRKFSYYE